MALEEGREAERELEERVEAMVERSLGRVLPNMMRELEAGQWGRTNAADTGGGSKLTSSSQLLPEMG